MELSWKPRRYGKRRRYYCSPACGADCSYVQFRMTENAAISLVKELRRIEDTGPWEPQVKENLGWHYYAESTDGRWVIHRRTNPNGYGRTYTACLGGHWTASAPTAAAAIKQVRKIARRQIREYTKFLDA